MVGNTNAVCEILTGSWKDFRKEVQEVNRELFDIIEALDPGDKYKLIKARYLYGEKITDLGVICVPSTLGKLCRLDDPQVSDSLKEQLGYCSTPLILQLSNGAEVFVEGKERVVPLNIFMPGDLYGLFEAATPITGCPFRPHWSVTSGARSVFFGAKISDAIGHKILRKKYGVPIQPPKRLIEQHEVFKAINKHNHAYKPWSCNVLIFTKNWFDKKHNDLRWLKFHHYLLIKSWIQSKSVRVKQEYDSLMWESFADFICKRNLKPGPYMTETIKHLLLISNGFAPGFKPINDNEILLPTVAIESAYTEDYKLKYAPIIMGPSIFNHEANDPSPIYYSLSYPTSLEGTPAIRYAPSIISELQEAKTLISSLEYILKNEYIVSGYDLIKDIEFKYFHDREDKFGEMFNSSEIEKFDPLIHKMLATKFKEKGFPSHSQFFRGCIQITKIQ